MSSEESFPTFVDVNPSHMAASSSADQAVSITVLVDQSSSAISNDSQSAENLQKHLVATLQSPDNQEIDIIDGEQSSIEDITHVWTREEVELLFAFYKERQRDIKDPQKKKRDVWVDIATELRQHGFNPTPKQCDRKLRNMKATYIKTLERMKRGDHVTTCQYYDELYDLYGLNPPLQTPQRFLIQNRNRPVPSVKSEYVNDQLNAEENSMSGSYESPAKKLRIQDTNQNGTSPEPQKITELINTVKVAEKHSHSDVNDLLEKTKNLENALRNEKEAREAERKAFEEERKEFHKERMAMLNSINKLIGNLDQTKT